MTSSDETSLQLRLTDDHVVVVKREKGFFADALTILVDGSPVGSASVTGTSTTGRLPLRIEDKHLELRWKLRFTGSFAALVLTDGTLLLASDGDPAAVDRLMQSATASGNAPPTHQHHHFSGPSCLGCLVFLLCVLVATLILMWF